MLKHILVPLDGSSVAEQAVGYAAELARRFDGKVTLLRVITPEADGEGGVTAALESERRERQLYLDGIAGRLRSGGVQAGGVVLTGDAPEKILEFAEDNGVEGIVLNSHCEEARIGFLFGSVAEKVVHAARCPVVVLHNDEAGRSATAGKRRALFEPAWSD